MNKERLKHVIDNDLRDLEQKFDISFENENLILKPISQLRNSRNQVKYRVEMNAIVKKKGAVILQTDYYAKEFYDFTLEGDIESEVSIIYDIKSDMIVRQPTTSFKVIDFALISMKCEHFDKELTGTETQEVYNNTADDIIETSHQVYLEDGSPLIFPLRLLKLNDA